MDTAGGQGTLGKVTCVDKAVDRVACNGDRDLDKMLTHMKSAIEA